MLRTSRGVAKNTPAGFDLYTLTVFLFFSPLLNWTNMSRDLQKPPSRGRRRAVELTTSASGMLRCIIARDQCRGATSLTVSHPTRLAGGGGEDDLTTTDVAEDTSSSGAEQNPEAELSRAGAAPPLLRTSRGQHSPLTTTTFTAAL